MYFKIRQDSDRYWRWRLHGGNHEIVAIGEAYTSKAACLHAIDLVKASWNAEVYE